MEDQPSAQPEPQSPSPTVMPPQPASPAPASSRKPLLKTVLVVAIAVLVIAVVAVLVVHHTHKRSAAQSLAAHGCIARQLAIGSSGHCVSDVQTMINFLETDDLTECPFTDGQRLTVNGLYDTTTETQAVVVQNWINCYNKQEGSPATITANGTIASSTWSGLCTYAYLYPKRSGQSPSPYLKASVRAGQDAGCAS